MVEQADKMHDPKGGLSAEGRKKFNSQGSNLKPGVTSYNGASTADKKRWVKWALRFTKSPRPLKKDNGDPTPYAKMFVAWGRPIPKNASDVKATHNLALVRRKALGMGDSASDTANLDHLHRVLDAGLFPCPEPMCSRDFVSIDAAFDHADAVHTFSDLRDLVSAAIDDKYASEGDYRADPPVPGVYTYVEDMADDWVVFVASKGGDSAMYKASYTVTDSTVTLGTPSEVRRRTVYEPVPVAAAGSDD